MIQSRRFLAAAALTCLIVGGCEKKAAEGNKAAGEVLEGTISDAMIATDEVRSEPPLAPHTAKAIGAKDDNAKGKAADEGESEDIPASEASPAGDAAPTPKPSASEPAG